MSLPAILIFALAAFFVVIAFIAWNTVSSHFSFPWPVRLLLFIYMGYYCFALFYSGENIIHDEFHALGGGIFLFLLSASPFLWIVFQRWRWQVELSAEQLANDGHFDDAIALLRDKICSKGSTLLLLNNLAAYLDAAGKYDEALDALEKAELRFGKQHILTMNKAFFLTHAGRNDEALAIVEPLLRIVPGDFDLICHYAVLLFRINLRDQAEEQYLRAEVRCLWEKSEELKKRWLPLLNKLRAIIGDGRHEMHAGRTAIPDSDPTHQHIMPAGKHPFH